MKTKIIIAVLIILGAGVYYIASNYNYSATPNIPATPVSNTSKAPATPSVTISIKNFSFNPSTLTVKAGTKVTWVNNDSVPHTITSDTGSLLNSPTLPSGQSFSFAFNSPGTANYHCNIHPNMKGAVVVTD